MTKAFIVMAALPPTVGHLNLINFAKYLGDTTVIVCTQPDEPYPYERYSSIRNAAKDVRVMHFHKTIEQDPESPGFWKMWKNILQSYGFSNGDYIVASEVYGQRLASEVGGVFMPYDIQRSIYPCKATFARLDPISNWKDILPEFRDHFVQTVTLFGAESVGKTTMSKELAKYYQAPWIFEWARPYLETIGAEVTSEKMHAIWTGQLALQASSLSFNSSPVTFQDTDLFSTLGYWKLYEPENVPERLCADALGLRSSLYLICPSNIPLEQDQLRYGGTERESSDQYWIDLCERYELNYRVLTGSRPYDRMGEATDHIDHLLREKINFRYERKYNDA